MAALAGLLVSILVTAIGTPVARAQEQPEARLKALIGGPQRTPDNKARDPFRHPHEVLTFFGIRPDSTVVEVLPGAAGYWTEILAPYVMDRGLYIAAGPSVLRSSKAGTRRFIKAYADKLGADPVNYGKVKVISFVPDGGDIAAPGSADFVLTFRNLHNWMKSGQTEAALAAFHKVLKPGGVLGIVEHRGRTDIAQDPKALSGYVRQDAAIAMIEKAGFRLIGSSEVNANPKDTKDYPAGVWTLPPSYRLKDKNRSTYQAIGESDRFTLKFAKK